eukprot:scaffold2134_cov93-Cylindrotheca_fusiformis.AAC.7
MGSFYMQNLWCLVYAPDREYSTYVPSHLPTFHPNHTINETSYESRRGLGKRLELRVGRGYLLLVRVPTVLVFEASNAAKESGQKLIRRLCPSHNLNDSKRRNLPSTWRERLQPFTKMLLHKHRRHIWRFETSLRIEVALVSSFNYRSTMQRQRVQDSLFYTENDPLESIPVETLQAGNDAFEPIAIETSRTSIASLKASLEETVKLLFPFEVDSNTDVQSRATMPIDPGTSPKATLNTKMQDSKSSQEFFSHTIDPIPISTHCSSGVQEISKGSKPTLMEDASTVPSDSTTSTKDIHKSNIHWQNLSSHWRHVFQELLQFREKHGHCAVPHTFPENPGLARWVKRQRYQHKLFMDGRPSNMTNKRIEALESVGFVWNANNLVWEERLNDLAEYRRVFGDCNVPTKSKQLGNWVKCQRRQYKKYVRGDKTSTMTVDRIQRLNQLGFCWEVRSRRDKRNTHS